jgi:hypothetical protein
VRFTTWARAVSVRASGSAGLALIALTLSSCGKASLEHSASHPARSATRGQGVPASAAAVIEGWANALRTGDLKKAAGYWALPSAMVNGLDASGGLALIRIRNSHEARVADESLPCGATLKSTAANGAYVRAQFILGARAGVSGSVGCSGLADVDFLIRKGRIERWLRAPVGPGRSEPAPGATSA